MPGARGRLLKAEAAVSKPSGGCYGALKKALSQLHRQQQAFQHANFELAKCRERQLCLLDLILHQELCLNMLLNHFDGIVCEELDGALPSSLKQAGPLDNGGHVVCIGDDTTTAYSIHHCRQHTRQSTVYWGMNPQRSATAHIVAGQPGTQQVVTPDGGVVVATGCTSTRWATPACSYVAGLLQTATDDDIHKILTLKPADWLEYITQLFSKLAVHLELADRVPAVSSRTVDSSSQQASTQKVDLLAVPTEHPVLLPSNPVDSIQQLQSLVDTAVRDVVLAYCYNHIPLLEACMTSCATGRVQTPPPGHWETVAKRLQLTDTQVLHYVIGYEEYVRLQASAAKQSAELLDSSNKRLCSLLEVVQAEKYNTGQQTETEQLKAAAATLQDAQQQGDKDSSINSGVDGVQFQLQHHMSSRHLQLRMVAIFLINTLSRLQLAQLVVGSFPYLPSLTAVARVVTADFNNRQQQQDMQEDDGEDKESPDALPRQQQPQQPHWLHTEQLRGLMQREIEQHVQERRELLEQQHTRWWQQQQQEMYGSILEKFL